MLQMLQQMTKPHIDSFNYMLSTGLSDAVKVCCSFYTVWCNLWNGIVELVYCLSVDFLRLVAYHCRYCILMFQQFLSLAVYYCHNDASLLWNKVDELSVVVSAMNIAPAAVISDFVTVVLRYNYWSISFIPLLHCINYTNPAFMICSAQC